MAFDENPPDTIKLELIDYSRIRRPRWKRHLSATSLAILIGVIVLATALTLGFLLFGP